MATWNSLAQPVYRSAQPAPDFFNRTQNSGVRQLSLAKVPGADPAILSSFNDASRLRGSMASDLSRYRGALSGTQPQASAYLGQELGDLSRLFSPDGYEADLAGIRGRRASALSNLDDQILGGFRRTLSSRAVGSGNTGLGSYLSRLAMSEAGKLRTQEAYDAAGQERADLASLMAGRNVGYGRRTGLLDANLARLLMPMQQEQAALGSYNTNLGSALQLALQNLVSAYGLPQ